MPIDLTLEPVKKKANGLARLLTYGLDGSCPVFLDTSAIIDLENELASEKARHKSFMPVNFYFYLKDALSAGLYVTDEMIVEAEGHNRRIVKGRQVLSDQTLNVMLLLNEVYNRYLQTASFTVPIDDLKYDVYWASLIAFDPDHKKSKHDPISVNDRSLISAALQSRYSIGNSGAVILSSDKHISETASVLRGRNSNAGIHLCKLIREPSDYSVDPFNCGFPQFNHTNLRVFSTRSNDHEFS